MNRLKKSIKLFNQEKAFHDNNSPNISSSIKEWLKSEYPRQFDPLSPFNFEASEKAMQDHMKDFEREYVKFQTKHSGSMIQLREEADRLSFRLNQLNRDLDQIENKIVLNKEEINQIRFLFITMQDGSFFQRCKILCRLIFGKRL